MSAVIGICPLYDSKLSSYWMLPEYMNMLEAVGAVPVMMPLTSNASTIETMLEAFDGFLLTGGQDVEPTVYGEARSALCGESCQERDLMDRLIIEGADARNKPLLGICRGIQILNVVLGGTLYQDLGSEHPGVDHGMLPPYDRPVHAVTVLEGTPLAEIIGSGELPVNSYHHQAIRTLSPLLQTSAVSEDGLIEAVWMPGKKFFHAVQWHPELIWRKDKRCRRLIEAFVKAAEN